jgi:CheY-like chemotaxis protein
LEADREEEEMKPRILVAEHDQATRDGIAAILETAEYQCLKVANTV